MLFPSPGESPDLMPSTSNATLLCTATIPVAGGLPVNIVRFERLKATEACVLLSPRLPRCCTQRPSGTYPAMTSAQVFTPVLSQFRVRLAPLAPIAENGSCALTWEFRMRSEAIPVSSASTTVPAGHAMAVVPPSPRLLTPMYRFPSPAKPAAPTNSYVPRVIPPPSDDAALLPQEKSGGIST